MNVIGDCREDASEEETKSGDLPFLIRGDFPGEENVLFLLPKNG